MAVEDRSIDTRPYGLQGPVSMILVITTEVGSHYSYYLLTIELLSSWRSNSVPAPLATFLPSAFCRSVMSGWKVFYQIRNQ